MMLQNHLRQLYIQKGSPPVGIAPTGGVLYPPVRFRTVWLCALCRETGMFILPCRSRLV